MSENMVDSSMPLVTVIVVSYNHAKFIDETLKSIENQSYSNLEIIISDNCSEDDSVEKIKIWAGSSKREIVQIVHNKKINLCVLLNEAISVSNGKYIQFISCDDILLPDKIESQVVEFEGLSDEYGALYSDAYLIDDRSEVLDGMFISRARKFENPPEGNLFDELLLGNFIPAMSALIRKEVMVELNGYDENLQYEDYDFWLRMARRYKFKFSQSPSCKYRLHDTNFHKSQKLRLDYYWILKKQLDVEVVQKRMLEFGYKMYLDGKTNSKEYRDYILIHGIPSGPNKWINCGIRLRIPFKYLLGIHNLLSNSSSFSKE